MNVLAIDSSNVTMGVAIANEEVTLGELITNVKKNHSVKLMPAIEQLMQETGIDPHDLERIAVAMGPGSYTGVRIGVTIAKTLAWTLQAELVAVSSLAILAQNGRFFEGVICPLFDARRGQVYTGLYAPHNNKVTQIKDDRIVLLSEWLQALRAVDKPILFLGQDVGLHQAMIREHLGQQAVFAAATENQPRPSELAWLGMQGEPVESIHGLVPTYLQLAEAETKWLAQQEGK
ncbi:tRNA (adenosine(37)-N6)-threonylcarbamoyltransferase complex dimerization subunit type 1 TsaB [Pullulanibacillus camelliae]|uniref:tRNA (Adenosine(37)-N6)-threonylcarbamoyltransferase complex dimerization subunit type 1 TsaB n=1 Tax=Pullulanibacillus camelliae TaxID=1707096 RepID=A0A8J2YNT4_9BACL|nr:tRNA (adenosine(37)-N6)-threonylcarbamoyltransferase complex dimerization subunit type 1 TsaB [Pullulanibacillus camelliae]GGE55903.1 tRNA (adenosine(37)-N6)-threonylcarbamoyltransferase complex dimerization subunit type 1 TsaB [Pullulanibacillus camelliae]